MATYNLAPVAEDDLDEIWLYIAQDDPSMAENVIRDLSEIFWMLAENPMAGKGRPDLVVDLRFFPHGDYCIFYYPEKSGVKIVRVIHSARDIEAVFDEETSN